MTGRIGVKDMTQFSKILKTILIHPTSTSPLDKQNNTKAYSDHKKRLKLFYKKVDVLAKLQKAVDKQNDSIWNDLTEDERKHLMKYEKTKHELTERKAYKSYRSANPTSFDDWVNDNPGTQGTYEGWADANPEVYNPTSDN